MALKSEPTGFDYWEVLPGQGHYYNPEFRTASGNVRREGYVTDVIADRALEWLERSGTTKPFMLMFQQKLAAPQLDARARALDAAPTAHRLVPVNLFRRLREPRLPARKQESRDRPAHELRGRSKDPAARGLGRVQSVRGEYRPDDAG
ncbi:MAG: hypothetical protein R2724_07820 [Bryobacterales bacterium]